MDSDGGPSSRLRQSASGSSYNFRGLNKKYSLAGFSALMNRIIVLQDWLQSSKVGKEDSALGLLHNEGITMAAVTPG